MLEEPAKHGQQGYFFFHFCSFCIQIGATVEQTVSGLLASLRDESALEKKSRAVMHHESPLSKDRAVPSLDLIFDGISPPSYPDAGHTNSAPETSCTYGRY